MSNAFELIDALKATKLDFAWEHTGGGNYSIAVRATEPNVPDVQIGPFFTTGLPMDRGSFGEPIVYVGYDDDGKTDHLVARTSAEVLDDIALFLGGILFDCEEFVLFNPEEGA